MTTLAAIQGDGWCAIAADSLATDDTGFKMHIVSGKIFKNGPTLIAGAGSVRGINILQHGWKAPKRTIASTDAYITKHFIPAMRKAFVDNGYDMKGDSDVATNENDLLVAVGGVLYSIADDYSWERCQGNIYVAGSGGKYAAGALAALGAEKAQTLGEASKYLNKAVRAAIRYDAYSGGEVFIVHQEG